MTAANPRFAGWASFAFAFGAGELDTVGFGSDFIAGFWALDNDIGLGEGRFGAAVGFWPEFPFAVNWKRFVGAICRAAWFGCSVFTVLDGGALDASSGFLFTPAAPLFATNPFAGRATGAVGRGVLDVPLDGVLGLPIDAINWLNACARGQYVGYS